MKPKKPKHYRGEIAASFQFEGDDIQLAKDHFEMLVQNELRRKGWKVTITRVGRDELEGRS